MLNVANIMGQVIGASQLANGAFNSQDMKDIVFTISCQRDAKPNGQPSQVFDTIPCICKGYMADKTKALTINTMVTVSGRAETGKDFGGDDFMVLNVSKINVI